MLERKPRHLEVGRLVVTGEGTGSKPRGGPASLLSGDFIGFCSQRAENVLQGHPHRNAPFCGSPKPSGGRIKPPLIQSFSFARNLGSVRETLLKVVFNQTNRIQAKLYPFCIAYSEFN